MTEGTRRIAEERQRQITECGWSSEHDDQHVDKDIAKAALVFLKNYCTGEPPVGWPKEWGPFEQRPPERTLEIVGALVTAELDRLIRDKEQEKETPPNEG